MQNRSSRKPSHMTPAEIVAAYLDDRDGDLLDAVVTAAALVARADGHIQLVERGLLIDFMDRNGFLSIFSCAEILDAFDRRVHQFEEPGGAEAAVDRLRRFAGRTPVRRLVIGIGRRVATADGHLHPFERHVLQRLRAALRAPSAPSAPTQRHIGGAR